MPVLAAALYFIPYVAIFFIVCGLIDVLRNDHRTPRLFRIYFTGNGMFTWLMSPINLLADLLSYRNRKVWKLDDMPENYRKELDHVLGVFRDNAEKIKADIDARFKDGRRGMYIFQWYGKRHFDTVPELTREFKYLKTVAVSVFNGRERTSFHFGPLRLTFRVLYNLGTVDSDDVYIECGNVKHVWRDDPLFIFDDTLLHRSVNDYDGRRYCVFMDMIRPSPFPRLMAAWVTLVARVAGRANAIFYKNWTMFGKSPGLAEKTGK